MIRLPVTLIGNVVTHSSSPMKCLRLKGTLPFISSAANVAEVVFFADDDYRAYLAWLKDAPVTFPGT